MRLNQVWVPRAPRSEPRFTEVDEDEVAPRPAESFAGRGSERREMIHDSEEPREPPEPVGPAERIALQPSAAGS